jgi:hypothetical protein
LGAKSTFLGSKKTNVFTKLEQQKGAKSTFWGKTWRKNKTQNCVFGDKKPPFSQIML